LVQDVCSGVEVKPNNASVGTFTSQKWNFGDGYNDTNKAPSHIYANPGIYKIQLKLTSALGCTDSTSKTILIYTKPIIKISPSTEVSKGYSTQLFATGGTDYLWTPANTLDNPASASPVATPDQDTRYTVKVMNAFGCFDTASVMVTLKADFAIEPQNLISPNGNGQNDVWKIKGIEFYPDAKVLIFDQWGRVVLEETNYKNTWDGTMKGKALPDGTYFYVISLPGTDRLYKGTINILKN
jgi:gliding motility-associated-like protein